jgi:thymidylate kinase
MIVEFIGCSGAGKTSLVTTLALRSDTARPTIVSTDLVTDRPGLRWITHPKQINLVADVISFPSFVGGIGHDGDFVRWAFRRLRHHAPSRFARYNYMLNVVRKVGVHEMARSASGRKNILVDEGVIQSAYQLFVYSKAPHTDADLDRFAGLVPLADRVVYIAAPTDLLVERGMQRHDARRELVGLSRRDLTDRLVAAKELFDRLAATAPIRQRLVTIEIGDEPSAHEQAIRDLRSMLRDAEGSTPPEATVAGPPRSARARTARGPREGERVRLIAFVGSEASGKSTVIDAVDRWLRDDHEVRRIHVGKPPSTRLTFVPHVLLPAMRKLFPQQRLLRVEARLEQTPAEGRRYPPLFAIRSVMLAYERRALIKATLARASNGTIVLSDRYPSDGKGAPDGPQLHHLQAPGSSFHRTMAALEDRLYGEIPTPDLVFHLSAPLDVTLARNEAREKTEPEEYVRFRHALSESIRFDEARVHRIDTDRDLHEVLREVQGAIAKLDGAGAIGPQRATG